MKSYPPHLRDRMELVSENNNEGAPRTLYSSIVKPITSELAASKSLEIARALEQKAESRRAKINFENEGSKAQSTQMYSFRGKDDKRPIANLLARIAIFDPTIRPGRRKNLENYPFPTHGDKIKISYTGKQLDQSDCDVFMHTIFLGQGKNLGEPHLIDRSKFLKALKKTDGGENYKWLDETFGRLVGAQLIIDSDLFKGRVTLISKWVENKATGEYFVIVDDDIKKLFGGNQYTLVDWHKRLLIQKRVSLAKWLQNWTCSHSDRLNRWRVNNLYVLCQYRSPIRKFREALQEALGELARVGVIADDFKFYENNEKIRWTRL